MKKVDFFIIGAPKCGTTSLYEYLYTHPEICFSDSKEPNYFSYDFPKYRTTFSIDEYYDKEFSHCHSNSKLFGESSVWYLYSKVAIKEIYKYNPDAMIIILLRNPLDMLPSLHSQLLYNLDEDIVDFETAWKLQEQRSESRHIPKYCRVAEFLQYKNIGMYSRQLKRVYSYFPKHQVKIILFDNLIKNPSEVYADTLKFLGLKNNNRTSFHISNQNKSLIFKPLAILIQRPPEFVTSTVKRLKKLLHIHKFGIYPLMDKMNIFLNTQKKTRKPLDPYFIKIMHDTFIQDINKTEKIINMDLSSWKNYSQ